MDHTPIAEGIYVLKGDHPRLIAGRRKSDGRMRFPMPRGADAANYEAVQLSGEGVLWSYTVQRFRPKSPPYAGADDERSFKPFAVGYVEFPGEVIAEGRILIDDFSKLKIGMPMRVDLETFLTADRGEASVYAFRPIPADPAA